MEQERKYLIEPKFAYDLAVKLASKVRDKCNALPSGIKRLGENIYHLVMESAEELFKESQPK